MFRGDREIREAYRDHDVARSYVDTRFVEPLGAMLHEHQLQAVLALIEREGPRRIVEIAPGPARLTRGVAAKTNIRGVMIDASLQMLDEARRRLGDASSRWSAVQGDAFALPATACVDFVYTFRLIRHFDEADRMRLYAEIRRMLGPGGWLMFDAVNEVVSAPLRAAAPSAYKHFDALFRSEALRDELSRAGLPVVAMQGVQHRYAILNKLQILVAPRSRRLARALMDRVESLGGEPLEWILTCRRE